MTDDTDAGPNEAIDGRTAAELYRVQRQRADGKTNGFQLMSPEAFLTWANQNRGRLEGIARANGAEEGDVEAAIDVYLELLRTVPAGAPFDDLNITLILAGVVRRVEEACARGGVPIGEGVAYGAHPKMGIEASQLAVMGTGASIITVSQGFPPFCNLISKAVALSMVSEAESRTWDGNKVRDHLQSSPKLRVFWTQILASYALDGWPPTDIETPHLDPAQSWIRLQVLQAMELFAVAHEYGHHVLKHGHSQGTDDVRDPFNDEHEADVFARMIGLNEGLNSEPPNLFSASGAGGVLMLGGIELVRRAKAVLETGAANPCPRKSHPPLDDRIVLIASADEHANEKDRPVFTDMRDCARQMLEIAWSFVEPVLVGMHQNGFRPQVPVQDIGGWLPGG